MKTIIVILGFFLSTIGFLSAQSGPSIKSDSIAKDIAKQPIFTVDSLQFAFQDKLNKPLILPGETQKFVFETDSAFRMPIANPRYKMRMPIFKPGTDYKYNMPVLKIHPR